MRFTAEIASVVLAATSAMAAPSKVVSALSARSTELCDSWDELTEGQYTIYQNNWGASSATSGSQCTTFDSISGTTVVWSTSWSWEGGSSSVKSYSNVALESVNKKLSAVSSIPSTWKWSYSGSDIVADVSYDLWLAPTSGGTNAYEIMVWLAALGGAGPISSTGSAVATATIGDHSFKLYSGPNGDTTVYSFVATETIESFSGDMMDFFNYLVDNEGVSDSYYITSLQAGTEPFTGSDAVFSTSAYSLTVS
ncbi:Xyloglucan-specific endo-beta-1,4-glucanase A [Cytospora mali]|uniref:Xyloglucan-specific endo-beta-1,4-glucanase A n=1 Tax=Cytospora mali TaxID=578113 RepID=A0A194UY62_CYTMA|nr:Xyloglucan-specific endo-beta-1,4-glucanase A [Valsa mali var. pyri (nom. inval.)]